MLIELSNQTTSRKFICSHCKHIQYSVVNTFVGSKCWDCGKDEVNPFRIGQQVKYNKKPWFTATFIRFIVDGDNILVGVVATHDRYGNKYRKEMARRVKIEDITIINKKGWYDEYL